MIHCNVLAPLLGFECGGGGEEIDRLHEALDERSSELVKQGETLEPLCSEMDACAETLQIAMEELEDTGLHVEDQVQEVMADLEVEKCAHKEALAALEEQRSQKARLVQEEKEGDQDRNTLCQESQGLSEQLVAVEREVREQAERAERALEDLRAAQAQQEKWKNEIREKEALIESLTQEVKHLKQKVETSKESSEAQSRLLGDEMVGLRKDLSEALLESQKRCHQIQDLVRELGQVKEQLVQQELTSGQELEQSKQKLSQQELTSEQLRMEVAEAKVKEQRRKSDERGTTEELKRINSDLEAEVATLKGKVTGLEEKERACEAEKKAAMIQPNNQEELVSYMEKVAELEKRLAEKEVQVSGLQKSLKEAQEHQEEAEAAAVKKACRTEVEKRKELLAVANEAIAHKNAELEKTAQEIIRQVISCPGIIIQNISYTLQTVIFSG